MDEGYSLFLPDLCFSWDGDAYVVVWNDFLLKFLNIHSSDDDVREKVIGSWNV